LRPERSEEAVWKFPRHVVATSHLLLLAMTV
jgi:hypothetical protein